MIREHRFDTDMITLTGEILKAHVVDRAGLAPSEPGYAGPYFTVRDMHANRRQIKSRKEFVYFYRPNGSLTERVSQCLQDRTFTIRVGVRFNCSSNAPAHDPAQDQVDEFFHAFGQFWDRHTYNFTINGTPVVSLAGDLNINEISIGDPLTLYDRETSNVKSKEFQLSITTAFKNKITIPTL